MKNNMILIFNEKTVNNVGIYHLREKPRTFSAGMDSAESETFP